MCPRTPFNHFLTLHSSPYIPFPQIPTRQTPEDGESKEWEKLNIRTTMAGFTKLFVVDGLCLPHYFLIL